MAVINPSVILRNWGLGIGTIYLTVAVPIFSQVGQALPANKQPSGKIKHYKCHTYPPTQHVWNKMVGNAHPTRLLFTEKTAK